MKKGAMNARQKGAILFKKLECTRITISTSESSEPKHDFVELYFHEFIILIISCHDIGAVSIESSESKK